MKGKLTVLLIVAFVDMLGLIIVYPLLPFYAESMGASAAIVGALIASFSVAQLLAAPVWGWLSDQYGRRPAILVGLLLSAVAYVIFAYANSIWLLLISRIVQGLGGGTIGVVQAYVSDVSVVCPRTLDPRSERASSVKSASMAMRGGVSLKNRPSVPRSVAGATPAR